MPNIIETKGAYRAELIKAAEEMIGAGWFMPTKPLDKTQGEFPADLSAAPTDELGRLMGFYAQFESYARTKTALSQQIMVIFKEYQLEQHDEQVVEMNEVILKLQAHGRQEARKDGYRIIYKYAESDFKKFDQMAQSYRNLKEAISREISRRDIRDRLGSYREMG